MNAARVPAGSIRLTRGQFPSIHVDNLLAMASQAMAAHDYDTTIKILSCLLSAATAARLEDLFYNVLTPLELDC